MRSDRSRQSIVRAMLLIAVLVTAFSACVVFGTFFGGGSAGRAAEAGGKLEVTGFTYTGDIYSYTQPMSIKQYMTVEFTDASGTTRELAPGEFVIEGTFAPSVSGVTEAFKKELTVKYTDTDSGETYSVKYEFDVKPAQPLSVTIVKRDPSLSVDAYSELNPNDFTVTVMYSGGRATLDGGAYTAIYGNGSGVKDESAEGFIYDGGSGTVFAKYSEAGNEVVSEYPEYVDVKKISVTPVDFSDGNSSVYSFEYDAESDTVTGAKPQSVSLDFFDSKIMTIAQVTHTDDDGSQDVTSTVTTKDENNTGKEGDGNTTGTLTLTDVGEYEITVRLTNRAYFWRDMNEEQTDLVLTYTINKAPLDKLSASFTGLDGDENKWNVGAEGIAVDVTGNYGDGKVTYHYSGSSYDGKFVPYTTDDPANIPDKAGNYQMWVTVAETDNFEAGSTESAKVSFSIGQRVLTAPTLTGKEYDGSLQTADISGLPEGYENGGYLEVTNVGGTNAGVYTVTFTITDTKNASWDSGITVGGNIVSIDETALVMSWQITPKPVDIPTVTGEEYTGEVIYADYAKNDAYTVTGDSPSGDISGTDAGEYTATFTLVSDNYKWSDNEGGSVRDVKWRITPKPIAVPTVTGEYTYNAKEQTAQFSDGLIGIAYNVTSGGSGTNAGSYTAVLSLRTNSKGETNYVWNSGSGTTGDDREVSWSVSPYVINTLPSVADGVYDEGGISGTIKGYLATDGNVFEGTGSGAAMTSSVSVEQNGFKVNGASVSAVNRSPDGGYKIKITLSGNYKWGDGVQTMSGDAQSVEISWIVARKLVGKPEVSGSYVYNGDEQTVKLTGDGKSYEVSGGTQTNAGDHTVTVTLGDNYRWDDDARSIALAWHIARAEVERPDSLEFTGGAKNDNTYNYGNIITAAPEGYYDGIGYYYSGDTTATAVKADGVYTVTLTLDSNHRWAVTSDGAASDDESATVYSYSLTWNVQPLAISLPTYGGPASAQYDSEEQTFTLSGWTGPNNGVTPINLVITSDRTATPNNVDGSFMAEDAGEYSVSVRLSDEVNFKWADGGTSQVKICDITITPVVLEVSGWMNANGLVFNNKEQKPVVTTAETNIFDGDNVTFVYGYYTRGTESEAESKNAGEYTARITSLGGSDAHNYTLIGASGIETNYSIAKYTVTTESAVNFERAIEYVEGQTIKPVVTITQPLGMDSIITYDLGDGGTAYGTYRITVTLTDTDNFEWEITDVNNPYDSSEKDEFTDETHATVSMWFQITRTQIKDEEVTFTVADTFVYGEEVAPTETSTTVEGAGEITIYYYGTPAKGAVPEGESWTATDWESKTPIAPKYVGSYTIVLHIDVSINYELYESEKTFEITPRTVTLTFTGGSGDQSGYRYTSVYGSVTPASVIADGLQYSDTRDDLGVTYTYSGTTAGGDSYNETTAPGNAGSYTVTVTITNPNYTLGSAGYSASFTVSKKMLDVTVGDEEITYGEGAPAYTLSYSGGWVNGDGASVVDTSGAAYSYKYNDTDVTYNAGSDAGKYLVTVSRLKADNYDFVCEEAGTLTVNRRQINLTVTASGKTYDGSAVNVTVSPDNAFGGDTINYAYTYTYNGSSSDLSGASAAKNAGSYTVTVTLGNGGDTANYVLVAEDGYSANFVISQRALTATFDKEAYEITYGAADPDTGSIYGITYSGWADGENESLVTSVVYDTERDGADYAPGAEHGSAGGYTVTATISGDLSNYSVNGGTNTATGSLTVRKKALTLTVTAEGKEYDGTAVNVDVSETGLYGTDSVSYSFDYTYNGSPSELSGASAAIDAGKYTVTVTLNSGSKNYYISNTAGATMSFGITKATLTVTVTVNGGISYGDALDVTTGSDILSSSVTGWKASDGDKGLLSVTGYTVTFGDTVYYVGADKGEYTVTPVLSAVELTNYKINVNNAQKLTVSARELTVTVSDLGSVYGEEPEALSSATTLSGGTLVSGLETLGEIISVTAQAGNGGELADGLTSSTPVGDYRIVCSVTNDNYAVTFNYTSGSYSTYTVSPATITGVTFTPYKGVYDASEHAVLSAEPSATTANDMTAVWHFRLEGDDKWTEGWENLTLKNAGTYTVYYYVSADNHNDYGSDSVMADGDSLSFPVTIDKIDISVAFDGTITYGDDLPTYDYDGGKFTSRVTSGAYAAGENFAALGLTGITISAAEYFAGSTATKTYTLTWTFSGEPTNYNVTADSGVLTVNKLAVSIDIDNAEGNYGADIAELTWDYTNGSSGRLFGSDKPFTLATTATKDSPVSSDINKYYIYPVMNEDVAANYEITFYGDTEYNGGRAGIYTIIPETLNIRVNTPDRSVYDGKAFVYTATVTSGVQGVTLEAKYWKVEDGGETPLESAPVNAGTYIVRFSSSDPNYTAASYEQEFVIKPAEYNMSGLNGSDAFITDGSPAASVVYNGDRYFLFTYVYDGSAHAPSVDPDKYIAGADNSKPYVSDVTAGKTNVRDDADPLVSGYYVKEITFTFAAGSGNYNAPKSVTVLVAVTPFEADVKWGDTSSFVYDGTDQSGKITPYYETVDGEQMPLEKSLAAVTGEGEAPRAFKDAGLYKYVADFASGDNAYGNYVLRTGPDSESIGVYDEQLFRITRRAVSVVADGGSMIYGDAVPQIDWTYAEDSAELIADDNIVITVTARVNADGAAVTSATDVGSGYVTVATASGDRRSNYDISFTRGTFAVNKRAIVVDITDVSSVYGEGGEALTASLASGSSLSAANAEVGPDGETLLGDNALIRLYVEKGDITAATVAGKYTIKGESLGSGNYDITFDDGVYEVKKATFVESDFELNGYNGVYDGEAHTALASAELVNTSSAAAVNGLTVEYYVTETKTAEGGTLMSEFMLTHVSETGTYYVYVVAKSGGVECYERAVFAFDVSITKAENKLTTDFAWSGLEYGVAATDNVTDAEAMFGSATLEGIYRSSDDTKVADTIEEFRSIFLTQPVTAGGYYASVTVAAGVHEGVNDYDAIVVECAFTVAKHRVELVWSLGDQLTFTGEAQTNALGVADDTWMTAAFSEYFTLVSTSGGTSGTGADGYPTIAATTAGEYIVTLTLKDDANYVWASGEETEAGRAFAFRISAQQNEIHIYITEENGWTYGDTSGKDISEVIGVTDSAENDKGYKIWFTVAAESVYSYRFVSTDDKGYDSSALPTDAGSYKLTITVAGNNDYGAVSGSVEFTIAKATMDVLDFTSAATTKYDGEEQTIAVSGYRNDVMTVSGSVTMSGGDIILTGTNVGTQSVTISLTGGNYEWGEASNAHMSVSGDDLTLTWTIEKGTPVFGGSLAVGGGTYGGDIASPSGVTAGFDGSSVSLAVAYEYSRHDGSGYESLGDVMPTDAGTYYVAVRVGGTGNYDTTYMTGADGIVYTEFTIEKATGAEDLETLFGGKITVSVSDNVYGSEAEISVTVPYDAGYTVKYTGTINGGMSYDSADVPTEAGSYEAVVTVTETDNYGEYVFEQSFDIKRAALGGISAVIDFGATGEWTYGDEPHDVSVSGNPGNADVTYLYAGRTNAGRDYESSVAPTEAGSYTVTATVAESANYGSFVTDALAFTIERRMIDEDFKVSMRSFVYGEEAEAPSVSGNPGGAQVTYTYKGATNGGASYEKSGTDETAIRPTEAGSYTLTVSVPTTPNYYGDTDSCDFYIERAGFVMSADDISGAEEGFTYGDTVELAFAGSNPVGSGRVVIYYYGESNDGAWSYTLGDGHLTAPSLAGEYNAVAVAAQSDNYRRVQSAPLSFTIERAEYSSPAFDMSGWTEESDGTYSVTYDGSAHKAFVTEVVGADGSKVTVEYSGSGANGVTHVSEGTVSVTATFSADSGNYNAPAPITVNIKVSPVRVSVVIGDRTSVYDGKEPVLAFDESLDSLAFGSAGPVSGEMSELGIVLEKDDGVGVGTYNIFGNNTNTDYYVFFSTASYAITAREVTVEITPGGGVYGSAITPASAKLDNVADGDSVEVTLTYSGTANDGTDVSGTTVPSLAGGYIVTATINDDNHILVGNGTAAFVVERASIALTADDISVGSPEYGDKVTPSYGGDIPDGAGAITWSYHGESNNGAWSFGEGDAQTAAPSLAGSYTVVATVAQTANYEGATASKEFVIAKKALAAPTLGEEETLYDGAEHSNVINGYDSVTMSFNGGELSVSYEGGSTITLRATDKGEYTVTVTLKDAYNYAWADIEGGEVALTWTIAAADDNTITDFVFSSGWTYGETPSAPTASSAYGVVTFAYAPYDEEGAYEESDWSADIPVHAGRYVIRAYVAETESYNGAEEIRGFVIEKATLTVTLGGGSVMYGEKAPEFSAVYSGFVRGDTAATAVTGVLVVRAEGYEAGSDVGEYTVTASGISAADYDIVYENGKLTVRSVSAIVEIDDLNSVYGDEIVINGDEFTAYGLVAGDVAADLGVTLVKAAGEDVGVYAITGTAQTENYNVTFIGGKYTITARKVTVEITSGGGVYGSAITPASAKLDNVAAGDTVDVTLTYSGTAYDGTKVSGTTAPALAGRYTVTATISDPNYNLVGVSISEFFVERMKVAVPAAPSKAYSGSAQMPDIAESDLYAVTERTDMINAGEYAVTITLTDTANTVWEDGSSAPAVVQWTITKRLLDKPSLPDETYTENGEEQTLTPVGYDESTMSISGNKATDAGEYTATVTLKDTANYAWADGSVDPVSITWTIADEEIVLTWLVITLSCVVGAEVVVLAIGIARRRGKNGGPSGGTPESGTPDDTAAADAAEGTEGQPAEDAEHGEAPASAEEDPPARQTDGGMMSAAIAGSPLLAVLASLGEGIASGILGAAAVGLLIAILVVFLKKKKTSASEGEETPAEAPEPAAEEPAEDIREPAEEEPETLIEAAAAVAEDRPAVEEPAAEEVPAEQPEPEPEPAEESEPEDEPDDDVIDEEAEEEREQSMAAEEIPEEWKTGLGMTAAEDGKVYFRYNFSFYARLIQASDEVQSRYGELCDEMDSYPRIKSVVSWKKMRVYSGRKTIAMMLFKGKKLCIAFALDPDVYANTKYRGEDMRGRRRYEKTPMLLRLTSARKVKYAKFLLGEAAAALGLEKNETQRSEFGLPYRSTEDLIREGLVKVMASDRRGGSGGKLVPADIAAMIRERITLVEARSALSDEAAAALIEDATVEPQPEPIPEPEPAPAPEAETAPEPQPKPAEAPGASESESEKESGEDVTAPGEPHAETPAPPAPAAVRALPVLADVPRRYRGEVNIDSLSRRFKAGETVTLEELKARRMVSKKAAAYKVLARGALDKPLIVEAQDFSLDAVKMITLTGGKARKVRPDRFPE